MAMCTRVQMVLGTTNLYISCLRWVSVISSGTCNVGAAKGLAPLLLPVVGAVERFAPPLLLVRCLCLGVLTELTVPCDVAGSRQ